MGFRFDLTTANWIATVLEPGAPVPLSQVAKNSLSGSNTSLILLASDTIRPRRMSKNSQPRRDAWRASCVSRVRRAR